MRKILIAAIGASLFAGGPLAATPSDKGGSEKVVCHTEATVGSRLGKTRACHTVAEWAELRRQARENVQNIQDRRPARISDDSGPGM